MSENNLVTPTSSAEFVANLDSIKHNILSKASIRRPVSDFMDLLGYEFGDDEHPENDADQGYIRAAVSFHPERFRLRIGMRAERGDDVVVAETVVEYHWKNPVQYQKEPILDFLDKVAVARGLAYSSTIVAEVSRATGPVLAHPTPETERRVYDTIARDADNWDYTPDDE